MPTVVVYNNIELHSVTTKRFEQEPVYDASHTDVIGSKFSMSFEGICHAQKTTDDTALPWIGQSGYGNQGTTQTAYNLITQSLWQPRQVLKVSMGGQMLFVCNPCDSATQYDDIDNGPKPKSVTLTHITSNNTVGPTFHVTFDIECMRTACPKGQIPPILNNRWSVAEGFDDEYYSTRTITGEMRQSSSALNADCWRYLIVPTLENGFKRASLEWNIAPDGLKINYVVTDKQVETAAPWPAAKISVRHSEGTGNGASFEAECHVTLHGIPGASKIILVALAVRIIESRIAKIKDMADKTKVGMVPVAFTMVDTIGERNMIEVYLKVQHNLSGLNGGNNPLTNANYVGTPIANIGQPLVINDLPAGQNYPQSYDKNKTPFPNPWGYNTDGTARVSGIARLVLQCFLQGPCDNDHFYHDRAEYPSDQPTLPATPSPSDPPDDGDKTQVSANPNIPPYDSAKAASLQNTTANTPVYTHSAAETILTIDPLRVQVPITANPDRYNGTDDTCVVGALGLPQATIIFHVESECLGKWPLVPEAMPTFTDEKTKIKGVLLGPAIMTPMPPTTDACAVRPIYHVSCRLVYALNRPPMRDETIPVGVLAWTNFQPKDTELKLSDLYDKSVQPYSGGNQQSPGDGVKY